MRPFSLSPAPVGVLVTPSSDCRSQMLMVEAWAAEQGVDVLDLGTSAEPNALEPGCGLVIALGGDGTILRALQLAMPHQVGVLGINFGTIGFLADRQRHELGQALDCIAGGEATVDARTALVASTGAASVVAFN